MRWLKWAGVVFLALVVLGALLPEPPWEVGLEAVARDKVRERLRDAASADFRNVRVYLGRSDQERAVCGEVNARNGFGGQAGYQGFLVLIRREGDRMLASPAVLQEAHPKLWDTMKRESCARPVSP